MRKTTFLIIACIALILLSCSKDEVNEIDNLTEKLEGKWNIQNNEQTTVTAMNELFTMPGWLDFDRKNSKGIRVTFHKDGKCNFEYIQVMPEELIRFEGTYTVDKNTVTTFLGNATYIILDITSIDNTVCYAIAYRQKEQEYKPSYILTKL